MASNQIETPELKYLWLFKKTALRCLVLLLNVYEFAKENSGSFKSKIVSAQNAVVSIFGPLYRNLKDLPEQIIETIDDKFDKYAPSEAKNFVTKVQALIYKTKPRVKKLVTTTQTVVTPLITITIFLLKITRYLIQSITPKPTLLTGKNKTPDVASKASDATRSLVGGLPLMGNVAQSLTTNPTDLANSFLKGNPILDAVNSAAQNSLDATNSIVGGIPGVGNPAQPQTTNPADLANSFLKGNPILDAVNSAAQNSLDAANSVVGGIPGVGDIAPSLTNPADLANDILNATNSLVNDNPLLGAINSAAGNFGLKPKDTGTKAALQAAYKTMELAMIPVIAQLWYEFVNNYPKMGKLSEYILPFVEGACILYNKVVEYMDGKGYSNFGYLPLIPIDEIKAAYKLVKISMDGLAAVGDLVNDNPLLGAINSAAENIGLKPEAIGTKAALQAAYKTSELALIPVIAQLWYQFVNKYPKLGKLSEYILPFVEGACILYNKVVEYMDGKGYSVFGYLPLVPIDEMKSAYKLVKTSMDGLAGVGGLLGIDNNKGLEAVGLLGIDNNKGLEAVGGLLGIDNNKGLEAVGGLFGINKNK